jgi:hypothetical protein
MPLKIPKSAMTTLVGVTSAAMMLFANSMQAAEHPLTQVRYEETAKTNTIDLVMSIDWNIDNPPANRGKDFVENILKQTSQSLFAMTEGRVKLGKVSVYSNKQFMDNTDIQYLFKNGRANASISGFNTGKGMTIQMFTETGESEVDHGKTVAHELGHYLLGIFDEYREEGKKSNDPGDPQDGDTPRNTIMNDHLSFETISTATDYADSAMQNTAHFRVYKLSAWETVISPNGNEPAGYPKRTQLQAFQGMTAPGTTDLTKPKTGWESALQIVYMGGNESNSADTPRSPQRKPGPINVIILDTTVAKPQFDAQINAAQQIVNASGSNVSIAVYAYPYANTPVIPLTVVSDADVKATIKTALSKITLASTDDEMTNGDRLFDWAETLIPQAFPTGSKSMSASGYYFRFYPTTNQAVGVSNGKVYYYDGKTIADIGTISDWLPKSRLDLNSSLQNALQIIKVVQTPADTPTVTLLTTANQVVNTSTAQAFADAGVGVNPIALVTTNTTTLRYTSTREATKSLYDLADMTQGTFLETDKESELSRDAVKAINDAEGDDSELVNDGEIDKLAAGNTLKVEAQIAKNIDGNILFQTYWEDVDEGKISYTLTDPKGNEITPTTLPNGITYTSEPDEGSASYTVSTNYANHDGKWLGVVTANSQLEETVFQEITSESNLYSELEVIGGTQEDSRTMVATMELKGPLAVHGAEVAANIYSADTGELVKATVAFVDDGVTPDAKKGDGTYSADISFLPVGEYEIVGKASSNGAAVFSTMGSTKKGSNQPDELIPAFQRAAFVEFKKEL